MSVERFIRMGEHVVPAEAVPESLDPTLQDAWRTDGEGGFWIDEATARAVFIGRVKAEAGRRILAAYPQHRQMNAQARATELLLVRHEREWTPEEVAEAAELQAMRDAIKAIRARSDEIEAGPILSTAELTEDATWATS